MNLKKECLKKYKLNLEQQLNLISYAPPSNSIPDPGDSYASLLPRFSSFFCSLITTLFEAILNKYIYWIYITESENLRKSPMINIANK